MKPEALKKEHALKNLLDLLALEGPSGKERAVAETIRQRLLQAGCPEEWISTDQAHEKWDADFETGNLIVHFPGTINGPRLLFSAHMDTVPICVGAQPTIQGERVVSAAETGLGGDDRAGCAAILTLAEILLKKSVDHPPLTLLFTIAEEGGLFGARAVDFKELGSPAMGFNLDGQDPAEIVVGAMGAVRWRAEIFGRSAHSGLEPEKGISAGLVAAKALSQIAEKGFFGRIIQGEKKGTSNVGTLHGGEATNQVMDHLTATGECRSHDPDFLEEIVEVYQEAFDAAAREVTDNAGNCAKVKFHTESDYRAFSLNPQEACVQIACNALEEIGKTPHLVSMDAGLDANPFNEKGLPTVTLGTGTHRFHTVDEYVEIEEYMQTCALLLNIVRLATQKEWGEK